MRYGQRREDQVGLLGRDARGERPLRVEVTQAVLHQAVALDDVRRAALHHRHVDVVLPQRSTDVEGAVVAADDDRAPAAVGVRTGVARGVVHVAAEDVEAGDVRHPRLAAHAGGEHDLGGAQGEWPALALDLDGPLPRLVRPGRRRRHRVGPVGHLHDLDVRLEPVADLVLGGEHRPVVGELQVGQVVVPDRVVQAERLVAVAPLVAGAGVLVDDQARHPQLAQPGPEADAALAAADDEHVGLRRRAQALGLGLAALLPRGAALVGAVLGAARPPVALGLLEALQLVERGEEGPRAVGAVLLLQAQQPGAPADGRLEGEPRGDDPAVLGGRLAGREGGRAGALEGRGEQVAHALGVLDRGDVPRERDQVAPPALRGEHRGGPVDVARGQGLLEGGQPGVGALRGRRGIRGRSLEGLGHGALLLARRDDVDPRTGPAHPARRPRGKGCTTLHARRGVAASRPSRRCHARACRGYPDRNVTPTTRGGRSRR